MFCKKEHNLLDQTIKKKNLICFIDDHCTGQVGQGRGNSLGKDDRFEGTLAI